MSLSCLYQGTYLHVTGGEISIEQCVFASIHCIHSESEEQGNDCEEEGNTREKLRGRGRGATQRRERERVKETLKKQKGKYIYTAYKASTIIMLTFM